MKRAGLDEIADSIGNCFRCPVSEGRKQVIAGEGGPGSPYMMVAQAPNLVEMDKGRILSGPSGTVLDTLLDGAGFSREDLYLTNLVKCPLPGCRRPKVSEMEHCMVFLRKEIEVIDPLVIITLGRHSTKTLLREYHHPMPPRNSDIPFLFGQFFRKGGRIILPLPHPSCILYSKALIEPTALLYEKALKRMRALQEKGDR